MLSNRENTECSCYSSTVWTDICSQLHALPLSCDLYGTRWTEPGWLLLCQLALANLLCLNSFGFNSRSAQALQKEGFTPSLNFGRSKMGALMADNDGRLLGLYDELSAFLTGINLYNSKGLSDIHKFLQLYNGLPWKRRTGEFHF